MYCKHKPRITKLYTVLYVCTVKNTARRLQPFGAYSKRNEIFIMTSLEYLFSNYTDEHKVEHRTKLPYTGIYTHLRNQPRQKEPNSEA